MFKKIEFYLYITTLMYFNFFTTISYSQTTVIDSKGTIKTIESSKWTNSGADIYNKNTGNVGVGTTTPTSLFHTNGTVRFQNLSTNTINDVILTTDSNGNVSTRTLTSLLNNNALLSLNGLTNSIQTFAVGTSGSDFGIISSGTTHTFNIPTASASNRGLLSTTDWDAFTNKRWALGGNSSSGVFLGSTDSELPIIAFGEVGITLKEKSNTVIGTKPYHTSNDSNNSNLSISSQLNGSSQTVDDNNFENIFVGTIKKTVNNSHNITLFSDFENFQNNTNSIFNQTSGNSFINNKNVILNQDTGLNFENNQFIIVNGNKHIDWIGNDRILANGENLILKDVHTSEVFGSGNVSSQSDAFILVNGGTINTKLGHNGSVLFAGIGTNTSNTDILTKDSSGNVTTRNLSSLLTGSAITSLNGLTNSLQTFGTGTTGNDFNIVSSGTTHTFNLPTASTSNRGLLIATDWNTFNNKQKTVALTTTGSSGAATFNSSTGALNVPNYTLAGLGGISLTGLSASAPLSYNNTTGVFSITSPLPIANGGTGSATKNFVDLTTNQTVAGSKTFSGNTKLTSLVDPTVFSAWVDGGSGTEAGIVVNDTNGLLGTQFGDGFLVDDGSGNISYDSSTYLTSSTAVTSFSGGTTGLLPSAITQGDITLSGTLLPANGGTGSAATAANGAILVGNGTIYSPLSAGAAGTVLKGNGVGTSPSYGQVGLTTDVLGILPISNGGTNNSSAFTTGSVVFSDGTKLTQNNAKLYWDNTNNRLGIGNVTPTVALDVTGAINLTGSLKTGGNAGTSGQVLQTNGTTVAWVDPSSLNLSGGSTPGNGPWVDQATGTFSNTSAANIYFNAGNVGISSGSVVPNSNLTVGSPFTHQFSGNSQFNAPDATTSSASFNGFTQIYKGSTSASTLVLANDGYTGMNGKVFNDFSKVELQNFTSSDAGTTQTAVSAVSLAGTTGTGTASFKIAGTDQLITNTTKTEVVGNLQLDKPLLITSSTGTANDPGTAGQVLVSQGATLPPRWNATSTPDATNAVKGAVQLAGDLNSTIASPVGTAALPKVTGLQGIPISSTAPTTGQALVFDGNNWVPTAIPSMPTVIKTTTTQVSSSVSNSTYQTINALTFNTVAGKNYRVKVWLVYASAATSTGIRLGPNAFTGGSYWYSIFANTTATVGQMTSVLIQQIC